MYVPPYTPSRSGLHAALLLFGTLSFGQAAGTLVPGNETPGPRPENASVLRLHKLSPALRFQPEESGTAEHLGIAPHPTFLKVSGKLPGSAPVCANFQSQEHLADSQESGHTLPQLQGGIIVYGMHHCRSHNLFTYRIDTWEPWSVEETSENQEPEGGLYHKGYLFAAPSSLQSLLPGGECRFCQTVQITSHWTSLNLRGRHNC